MLTNTSFSETENPRTQSRRDTRSTWQKEFISNPSIIPTLLNTGILAKSYTSPHILLVLDFWAVTTGRTGCSSGYYSWSHPQKKAGTKHAGNAAATPFHKAQWTFNQPSLNLPRFSSSLPASHFAAGRALNMQNEAFLLLREEHCRSTHLVALTRKPTPPSG